MYVKTAVQLIDLLMVAVMHFWGMRSFFVVARIIKECRITMHNIKDKKRLPLVFLHYQRPSKTIR